MTLSIIIPNFGYGADFSRYLDVSLTMLNNQGCVPWKDTVEILILNEEGKSVTVDKYNKIKDNIIQLNGCKTLTKSLKAAMDIITGKYVTFIEPFCCVKNTTSINRILTYITDGDYDENIRFGVNRVMWNGRYWEPRSILGKVYNVQWMKDNGIRLDTNEFVDPLYYLAATAECKKETFMVIPEEEFMFLSDNFVEMDENRLNEIASIESFVLNKKCYSIREKYLNNIVEACYLSSMPLLSAPLQMEPKVRAKMISTIKALRPICVDDIKMMGKLNVPGDATGKESERLDRFLNGVLGGLK